MIVPAVLCIAVALFLFFFITDADEGSDAVIIRSENGQERISLLDDKTFSILSHGITLVIEVKEGEISVVHSDCPDQTCISMAPISLHKGGSIVCLPALLEIRSEGRGSGQDEPHAVAY